MKAELTLPTAKWGKLLRSYVYYSIQCGYEGLHNFRWWTTALLTIVGFTAMILNTIFLLTEKDQHMKLLRLRFVLLSN